MRILFALILAVSLLLPASLQAVGEIRVLNPTQFTERVIRPTLKQIGLHSATAERLLLGTALQESRLTYLAQLHKGPAIGLYQMEPATHDDIWENYLKYKPKLAAHILALSKFRDADEMLWNLKYATAMTRVHYLRVPHPLPSQDDTEGLAKYWKKYYNTPLGKGTWREFAMKLEDLRL